MSWYYSTLLPRSLILVFGYQSTCHNIAVCHRMWRVDCRSGWWDWPQDTLYKSCQLHRFTLSTVEVNKRRPIIIFGHWMVIIYCGDADQVYLTWNGYALIYLIFQHFVHHCYDVCNAFSALSRSVVVVQPGLIVWVVALEPKAAVSHEAAAWFGVAVSLLILKVCLSVWLSRWRFACVCF